MQYRTLSSALWSVVMTIAGCAGAASEEAPDGVFIGEDTLLAPTTGSSSSWMPIAPTSVPTSGTGAR